MKRLVVSQQLSITRETLLDRNPGYLYSLHHRPHNSQTTSFCGEGVNLIGALSDIAKEAFDRIGRTDIPMHHLGKGIKREQMLFVLYQATDRFGIALLVLAFE